MEEREEESRGEDSGLIPQIDRPMSMPYLCCKLWRWRELQVRHLIDEYRLKPSSVFSQ